MSYGDKAAAGFVCGRIPHVAVFTFRALRYLRRAASKTNWFLEAAPGAASVGDAQEAVGDQQTVFPLPVCVHPPCLLALWLLM